MDASAFLIVGRVRKVHGLQGELVVEAITDAPDAVFAPGRRVFGGDADGDLPPEPPELHVVNSRPFKGGLIVAFAGISSRALAEPWRGRFLLAPRDDLPPPTEDEIYLHDLHGLRVELPSGEVIGEISDVFDLPHGVLLDVKRAAGSVVIPFTENVVVDVDVGAGRMIVDPPEGLLD